jgi:hypothetical protein
VYLPSLFLVELFRRSRERITRSRLVYVSTQKYLTNNYENLKKNYYYENKKAFRKLLLPWWCRIVAFFICIVLIAISIFFILIKGIEFGEIKAKKWLTSLLVSFLASVFITQPLKVVLVASFCILLFRSSKDDQELDENEQKETCGQSTFFKTGGYLSMDEEWMHIYKVNITLAIEFYRISFSVE